MEPCGQLQYVSEEQNLKNNEKNGGEQNTENSGGELRRAKNGEFLAGTKEELSGLQVKPESEEADKSNGR
ncbi:hypothetical protein NDU88_000046 [Pleurodeles waltl]|uniref:Uncharacterized protein n=1 Tax=Pleurodeles waltl TaxID=8319 RepID=A0AAV7KLF7_PLEWA|nr:hypothetical protein NDU88_000046 [Pleurodeles waltl]